MSRLSRDKYFPNEGNDFVDEILRRNANLERRISDLERALMNQDTPPALPRINPITYPEPYEGQRGIDILDEQHTWYSDGEWRKAATGGGNAIYAIEVFETERTLVVGDNAFEWEIPESLDGAVLIAIEGYVTTVSSSGPVEVQIANEKYAGGTVDMLSTKLSIDAGEKNSADAATPVVINTANDDVAHKDHLRVDVDSAGVGATGLGVILTFIPNSAYAMAIQGQQGDPGGVTAWTGQWLTATAYTTGQAVSNNGTSYVAIANHTSGASTEPGVGANWQTVWQVLVERDDDSGIEVFIGGGQFILAAGIRGAAIVPFDCTIVEATLIADTIGNVVLDIWKDTYGNYQPTNADSICGGNELTLSVANKTTNTTLTGWTTALTKGDILFYNIDSAQFLNWIQVTLRVARP